MATKTGELVSRGATLGWKDGVHGELWIMPDGILRTRSGWAETFRHGLDTGVRGAIRSEFTDDSIQAASGQPGNVWVRIEDIQAAHLRKGILTGRLRLELTTGVVVKLLWQRRDGATEKLLPVLTRWLGDRLRLD